MRANLWIDKINFKSGTNISLQKNSIVIFVGPNNSGKSHILREIHDMANGRSQPGKILETVEVSAEGNFEAFLTKIEDRRKGDTYYYHDNVHNSGMDRSGIQGYWESALKKSNNGAPAVANFFVKNIDTAARLNLVSPAGNIDVMSELKTHPIHALKQDTDKEVLFSEYFRKAFGEDLIVNHGFGGKVPLHVGSRPIATAENDRVSIAYQSLLRQLPFLHEQGDGMKSFAGVFLTLFIEDFSVNLVDEPEAFLHPPQAALLSQMIGQTLDEKQIFLATHSEHLLKGSWTVPPIVW